MTQNDPDPATAMQRLVEGFRVSQAIHVAATLGIADLLAGGSRTSDQLAEATGTHPTALYRLLRALASVNVLQELADRRFALTPLGEHLRSDVPGSIAGTAAYIGRPYIWQVWAELLYSVRTGENAFRHVHGTDLWTYRASHPEENAIFNRSMASNAGRWSAAFGAAYDFGRFHTLVDVGGGDGTLLAAILAAHPGLNGVVFDQPHVVARAPALLAEAGVAERCRVVGGDFFAAVPSGGDAYVLRAVIHDWEDEEAGRILAAVRQAIRVDGTLLLVERVLAPPNEGPEGKFSDLNMLVTAGGHERSAEEFATLLAAARFQLSRIVPTGQYAVIEAAPD